MWGVKINKVGSSLPQEVSFLLLKKSEIEVKKYSHTQVDNTFHLWGPRPSLKKEEKNKPQGIQK